VRRAMTDLTNDDRLIKVNSVMKAGKYGKPNHMWRLARY